MSKSQIIKDHIFAPKLELKDTSPRRTSMCETVTLIALFLRLIFLLKFKIKGRLEIEISGFLVSPNEPPSLESKLKQFAATLNTALFEK